jgi:hypothetical protein
MEDGHLTRAILDARDLDDLVRRLKALFEEVCDADSLR